jgi:NACHT domain/Heterokaryon incompatibility protein (HET)
MRLLHKDANGDLVTDEWLTRFPEYVVLSHTWLSDKEEIKYDDIVNGTAEQKPASYDKIQFCGKQAAIDGYKYFWVDTCCIDKSSSAEVQEAITAMFRWYRNAGKCYAYLTDVFVAKEDVELLGLSRPWEGAFRRSRWFTRGWTLQELLAPATIEFYSAEGILLGDKKSLKHIIHDITGIPLQALQGDDLSRFSASERLSWAKHRQTTRVEDQAYCLLGILEIYMPLIYGEDEHAMVRLQQEVEKKHGELAKWDHLLESLPIAPQAAFNSLDNQHGPTCLTNTRVELLRDLTEWADGSDVKFFYWLNGIAGTGKSTVARTIARKFHEKGILGGSFFFSKGGGDVSHANLLFTTLASQLASRFPSTKRHICEAIMMNKDIAQHSLRDQWDQLIINPLAKINDFETKNIILVLDALDECDNDRDIRIILRLVSTARVLRNVRLRVFVASRPEIPIRCDFSQIPEAERQVFFLHDILPTSVDRDLNLFFQQNLAAIGEERGLAVDWPGSKIIARLVEISCGLFIWASTACRYIREGGRFAVKRLETVIKGRHSGAGPEKQLDAIYTTVLQGLIQQGFEEEEKQMMCETIKEVVGGIVTLFSPLSAPSLAILLDREVSKIDETLADLHTIFNIPNLRHRPIRLHHPTFRDFLVDKTRCKNPDFWVDQKMAHKALADSCIRIMRKMLKRDICDLRAPGTLATDVDQSRIERCIPQELQYACLYWAQHYRQSGALLGEHDTTYSFLKEHYLHWLEVMNLMGKSSEIAAIIRMYQALLVVCTQGIASMTLLDLLTFDLRIKTTQDSYHF